MYEAGIRGGYLGIGKNEKNKGSGNLATAVGLTGIYTIDDGLSANFSVGFGLQDRGRNSLGQFTSQTLGIAGNYEFWNSQNGFQGPSEGITFGGIYGGTANSRGGGHLGWGHGIFIIGLNRSPVYGGLIIDINKMKNNIITTYKIITGGGP
jgi:hypothetical protein